MLFTIPAAAAFTFSSAFAAITMAGFTLYCASVLKYTVLLLLNLRIMSFSPLPTGHIIPFSASNLREVSFDIVLTVLFLSVFLFLFMLPSCCFVSVLFFLSSVSCCFFYISIIIVFVRLNFCLCIV